MGIRLRMLVGLSLSLALALGLFALASSAIARRSQEQAQQRSLEILARALAQAHDQGGDLDPLARQSLSGRGDWAPLRGITLREGAQTLRWGEARGRSIHHPTARGELVLWTRPATAAGAPLDGLLTLYLALIGCATILLAYLALTMWIVIPLKRLQLASERVARGQLDVQVPRAGPRELATLATSFNEMSSQLREERARLQQKVRELKATTQELSSAQEGLIRSERLASVGRLAAGIAHEIGNPLTAIRGMLEVLPEPSLSEGERAEFLSRAARETERIHRIIGELLAFSRVSSARDPLEGEGVESDPSADLRAVIDDAIALIVPQRDTRQLRIETILSEIPRVCGSHDRLEQVVLNLLLNAADAIEGEGTITITLSAREGVAQLSVQDTGPGIAEAVLGSLFEPFVTTKLVATERVDAGTGLGLAVASSIVDALGGEMGAENPPEGGAKLWLKLPLAR